MSHQISTTTKSILLLAVLGFCQSGISQSANAPASEYKRVSTTVGRPVAVAAEMLEKIYDWPITYEDPITVNESLLEDVTEQVQRSPDPTHRVICQKLGTLSFTYKLPASGASPGGGRLQSMTETEGEVADALSSVLEGYANSGGLETFTVTEEDGVFHVFPINFVNEAGKLQQMTPILDTKITILPKQRTRVALLEEICKSLTDSTGISVAPGMFPFNRGSIQAQTFTTIAGTDMTARSLLSRLIAELAAPISEDSVIHIPGGDTRQWNMVVDKGGPMSWRLLYGPGSGFALNIHKVTPANQ